MNADVQLVRTFILNRINPTPVVYWGYFAHESTDWKKLDAYYDVLNYIKRIEDMYDMMSLREAGYGP